MGMLSRRLLAQSSDGPAVLKIEPWIVDSTTPFDAKAAMEQLVRETWTCEECCSPRDCVIHSKAYLEVLEISQRNR